MLLDPGEKFAPAEYENLPCSFKRFNKRKTISALNKEKPDFNFIKGKINKNIGAANKMRPAKTSAAAKSTERMIIKSLMIREIFLVFALANADKIKTKIIKIIIPKKSKFIY